MKYTIKQLEWYGYDKAVRVTDTVFGRYTVFAREWRDGWWIKTPEGIYSPRYKTAKSAKAAAEAEYQQRVMPALVEQED